MRTTGCDLGAIRAGRRPNEGLPFPVVGQPLGVSMVPADSIPFLHDHPDLKQAVAAAIQYAGPAGVDSFDLLIAAIETQKGSDILARLGVSAAMIRNRAMESRQHRIGRPGLSADAKRVIEAIAARAIQQQRGPDIRDLLIAVASAKCAAREVLEQNGIDEARLAALSMP